MDKRDIALKVAFHYLGRPYIWGGDNPSVGFDCSGYVIEILKSCDILPPNGDWTAHGLYGMFVNRKVTIPTTGCLVFWERTGRMRHVEFCLNDFLSIGASGGGSDTIGEDDAIAADAYIKVRAFQKRAANSTLHFVDPFGPVTSHTVDV